MRTCLLFFIITTTLFYNNYCKAQDVHFDTVVQPEGGWGAIHAIAQDYQGFLWIATDNGLYKYDGLEYISYRNEPSNSNSVARDWIESLYADKDGFLLIGTHGSGLDRFDISTGKFTHYRYNDKDNSSLSNDIVTAIIKDKQGILWIGTHDGLNRFDTNTGKFTRYKNNAQDSLSLSDNQVRVLFVDHEGILWVGTKSPWEHDGGTRIGGLNKFIRKTGKFTRYMHNPADSQSIIDNCVTAIFEDSRGVFWIGTAGNGVDVMNKAKGTFQHYLYNNADSGKLTPALINHPSAPSYDYITFIKEDNKKKLWIGTLLSGLNIYDPATQKINYYGSLKTSKEQIADNKFSSVFNTADGLFWLGAWSGNLYKINPYKTPVPTVNIGKEASDFYEDSNGDLWMTAFGGLLKKSRNGSLAQFLINKQPSSADNNLTAITEDNDHSLWFASMQSGVYHFNPITKALVHFHREDGKANGLICDTVLSIAKSKDNKLWIGTANGLDLIDISSGTIKHYVHDAKDTNSLGGTNFSDVGSGIYCVTITRNNNVWLTVANAVNRLDKTTDHFKRYIFNIYPNYILEDKDENIWVATDAGLFRYDKKADIFLRFYDSSGILKTNTRIYNISEDNRKNLWLRIDKGFIKLNPHNSEASIYKNDGNPSGSPVLKSYTTKSGEILSGVNSGYYDFYPDNFLKDPAPVIAVTGFSLLEQPLTPKGEDLLNKPVNETNEIHLKHNQNIFSFEFTCIDFTGNGEKKYILYMLDGYDKNWRKAESLETAKYYSVPPGKYFFKVKALGSDGIWAEKNISVIISPPWWTTWWAFCIYGVLFIAVMYMLQRLQKQRVIQIERNRTRERELAQAKEIEKAYEKLKSTQAQLIQSEKMASLGELTAGIAHEIQNPLNFVNNFSEVNKELVDELQSELQLGDVKNAIAISNNIKENEEKINYHGKRADAIVKNMLQHSRQTKGVKEPTDINKLADEYLRLSYHGLRAKDKNFNADFKTEFDESIGKINIVPQDIGRVLLNLFNNAFYAVNEKLTANRLPLTDNYKPTVTVQTKKLNDKVEIKITDNGNGIPQNIIDKIFQPFFTTKPTGEGTGLGLSLAYDIITKEHNGTIKAESKEGEGSEFIIDLSLKE